MSEYAGPQVVGIDLHRRRSVIVRQSESGEQLAVRRIVNDPAELVAEIGMAGRNPRVVLEATSGWYWAADVLADAGVQVHLAYPLGIEGFAHRRVNNDIRDATDLADLLRMGRLPEAWIAPPAVRALRELVRYRAKLVAQRLAHDPGYHTVQQIPGIGPTLAAVFVAEIGNVTRFTGPRQRCSWAGLTPRHRESDTTVRRGPITKQGSTLLRWAAVEAAQKIPDDGGWLTAATRTAITAGRGRNTGTVAWPQAAHPRLLRPARRAHPLPGRPGVAVSGLGRDRARGRLWADPHPSWVAWPPA